VAGFVAKTKKTEHGKESKLFVNIVSSDKIAAPTKTSTSQGQNWSLPYSLGPPHMEKDKGGEAVPAFDCCFHPEALLLSNRSKQFRDLLVSTALSGIDEAFRRQRQEVALSKEFHVLKGVTYKSGQIPSMLLDLAGKSKWSSDQPTEEPPQGLPLAPKTSPAVIEKAISEPLKASASAPAAVPAIQKGFLNKPTKTSSPAAPSGSLSPAASLSTAPPLVQEVSAADRPVARKTPVAAAAATGPVAPEYSLTERGVLSLGDFGSMGGVEVTSTRPAELVYRIDLPLATKTSEVALDVGER
jgi:hypothetical protein